MIRLLVFVMAILLVLNGNVCPLFAKAPTTPKIVFTSSRADGNARDIYIMDTNGHNQVNLTDHHADDLEPVWSPTGEHILFVSDRAGVPDLYLMEPDGSNVRRIFKENTFRETPIWSPDGEQIVYVHNRFQLNIAKKDGTEIETLTELFVPDYVHPDWSPEGTKIAFDVLRKMRTHLIDLQTLTRAPLLPELNYFMLNAEWSLDGKRIAFAGMPKKQNLHLIDFEDMRVYIVNVDGTGLKQIVVGAGPAATQPTWSPRGDALLFQQVVNKGKGFVLTQLFKVNLQRPNPKQLTDTGKNFDADWFDPAYALPVSPQPHLLTTTWGEVKQK